jgi:hemerythrin-like domain-containing protein
MTQPEPAPDPAPHTETPNSAVLDFSGVHRVIRGFMTKLDGALANPRSEASWAKKVAEFLLFGVAGLRFHHHVEDDEYWPALVAKGADATLLEPLQAAHRAIDPMLDQMEARAKHLRANPTDAKALAAVTELVPEFRDHVREHLDEEEPIIFPLLTRFVADNEAHAMATRAARNAPKKGASWLMGGVTYAMTPAEAENFMSTIPKPVIWLRPLLLRTYRRNCASMGMTPEFPQ